MPVIHNRDTTNPLSFPLQYLNSNHVTYYVITCNSAFDWVYGEQWYVIITSDVTWTEGQIKVPELESKLVVHSSIITYCISKGIVGTRSNWTDPSLLSQPKPVDSLIPARFWPTLLLLACCGLVSYQRHTAIFLSTYRTTYYYIS